MSDGEWTHPTLTRDEFDARARQLYEEGGTEEAWWYISFASDEEFLGGLYIRAWHSLDAIVRASAAGLNPGGEALTAGPISDTDMDENVPERLRGRLLTREELDDEMSAP